MSLPEKVIKGFKGEYFVRSDGNVVSNKGKKPIVLKPQMLNGKLYVLLYNQKAKKYVKKTLARLVGNAFVSNPNKFNTLRYIDGDVTNVNADNLAWVRWQKCISCTRYSNICSDNPFSCIVNDETILDEKEKKNSLRTKKIKEDIDRYIERLGGIEELTSAHRYIAQELSLGEPVSVIAERYGCSVQYIYRVRKKMLGD